MKKTFIETGDGSITLHIPEWNEQYHSKHGAIAEANHVFIKEGWQHYFSENTADSIKILEIGFGTGLNALLTFFESQKDNKSVMYQTVEAYPLELEHIEKLNYPDLLNVSKDVFLKIHTEKWEIENTISDNFSILKQQKFFDEIENTNEFNLIYFDAFGARVQPELWTESIFSKMYQSLQSGGKLVTYAANGNARRAMLAAGFLVERLPGPPGKREMLRATKG